MTQTLGVLGGLGPHATVDFLRKLLQEAPAHRDQEHVPYIVYSNPATPDRSAAIVGAGDCPWLALRAGVMTLENAGVTAIAIPCNSAHYWHAQLAETTSVPIFDLVSIACRAASPRANGRVGILGTEGLVASDLYGRALESQGAHAMYPTEELQREISQGIALAKSGIPTAAGALFAAATEDLFRRGADTIILACTEIAMALEAVSFGLLGQCIDTNRELARTCVTWWHRAPTQSRAGPRPSLCSSLP